MFERLLEDFNLDTESAGDKNVISLTNDLGYTFTLSLITPTILRTTLTGSDRPLPPHDNLVHPVTPIDLPADIQRDDAQKSIRFSLADGRKVILTYKSDLQLQIWEDLPGQAGERMIFGTLPRRGYVLSEHGICRYDRLIEGALHVGLGEKAGPMDLTGRLFEITGTDAAAYDAYLTDPLYKHTPFLITLAKPYTAKGGSDVIIQPSSYANYHTTNSDGTWDIHHKRSDPQGYFSRYSQDWGGLEELIILEGRPSSDGKKSTLPGQQKQYELETQVIGETLSAADPSSSDGLRGLVRTFSELVGKPLLVPRDWLGYLASGMGLGESDEPQAQKLLEGWPASCKEHDIPCSAMHLSSGYTASEQDGKRYVFTMNKKRYPDFKAMTATFHEAGIKVCPNIKPYLLATHPHYERLQKAGALFKDPFRGNIAVTTPIWSAGVGESEKGSWADMTHPEGRAWWAEGVESLVSLGCDAMWNDNNEFLLHNDMYIPNYDQVSRKQNVPSEPVNVGLLGRMYNTQIMGKVSHDVCVALKPERRPFVLTRSGNVGTFRYAASTWSGDNYTSWKTLQGSVAMGLNAGISLMQSYGSDVGGFAGPLPTPELFVRWVQFGCTNSRFCIHSFKPDKDDPSGAAATNLPWMYPEITPIIRRTIKRRYELLPYFNALNWESHLLAEPPNSWLGHGEFSSDVNLYTDEVLNGFDYWMGTGRVLVCGAYFAAQTRKRVYFPKNGPTDTTTYIRVSADRWESYPAGTWAEIEIPLEEFAFFARAGTVLPIGRDIATVTAKTGLARTAVDGVEARLIEQGGVVGLDDWRGIEIFPPRAEHAKSQSFRGSGSWIEDDGVSRNPETTVVKVEYRLDGEGIAVQANFIKRDFDVAWGRHIWVVLPAGDDRQVVDALEAVDRNGRKTWKISVS